MISTICFLFSFYNLLTNNVKKVINIINMNIIIIIFYFLFFKIYKIYNDSFKINFLKL